MFYGEIKGDNPITDRDGGFYFQPTDPGDHIFTPFIDIDYSNEKGRTLKLTLAFSKSVEPTTNLNIFFQRQDQFYSQVGTATIGLDLETPEKGVYQKVFELPEGVKSIRLVIVSLDGQGTFLPESVRIEQETQASNWYRKYMDWFNSYFKKTFTWHYF